MNQLTIFAKKLTALSLAALLLGGASVFAKTYDDVPAENAYREQIDLLSDIGVIVGTSENEFSPDEDVSREQTAMLMFRLMLGKSDAGKVNTTDFTDLYDDTYHGAISWANAAGYIIGTTDSTFEPTGDITLQDAMTMLVRALGQSTASMDKGYPWTYIDAAVKLGLDRGLEKVAYTAPLTRAQTACILYNALTAEYLIGKTTTGGVVVTEKTTIAEYVFGYEIDDGILSATNTFALEGFNPVVKDGYVSFLLGDGRSMTVKFSETKLDGTPESWLGKSVKLVYSYDSKTKLVNILGSSYTADSESFDSVSVADNNSYIKIGDVAYNIVEKYSDALSTNANELMVYAYSNDGVLVRLENNAAIRPFLGFYTVDMFDDNCDGAAERAIIKNAQFGRLSITIDGQINLAGNLTSEKLTGGFINEVKAQSGDYVLYTFNKGLSRLEITEVLKASDGAMVTKLTDTEAVIGENTYKLGKSESGVAAADIKAALAVGKIQSVVAKNGYILAVPTAAVATVDSQYLVANGNSLPVYTDGTLKYVVSVNLAGKTMDVVTTNPTVTKGGVYRYVVDANGVYTLIASDAISFVQSGEFTTEFKSEEALKLTKGSSAYYTLGDNKFITDSKTVIIVKNGSEYEAFSGAYGAGIAIDANARVTMIFTDNAGSVETLRFMFVESGSLDTSIATAQYVKILKTTGSEYENGKVYTSYEVFNFTTGKRENLLSLSQTLTSGSVYSLDADGKVTSNNVSPVSGVVTGYSAATITVGGEVYKLASETMIVKINSDLTLTALKLSDIHNKNVEFTVSGGEVKSIVVGEALSFTAAYNETSKQVVITPNIADSATLDAEYALTKIQLGDKELNLHDWNFTKTETGFAIQLYSIDGGDYTFTFTLDGITFTASVTLPELGGETAGDAQ